jgi:osmoprotectant transport system substrate-binding protein
MNRFRHTTAAALVAMLALALAACGSSSKSSSTSTATTATSAATGTGAGKPAVTIGDKNFPEEFILGQLYAQALQAKGYKVNLKENIGSSEITDKALTSHQIDMYPEYTGTILSAIKGQTTLPSSASEAYNQAQSFEESRGYKLLDPTPFADSDVLGTTTAYASKHHLKSVADLASLGKAVKLGGAPEFATRNPSGLPGIEQVYHAHPTFVPIQIAFSYKALDSGQVDVQDVFTTDGQLLSGKYVLLSDPKGIFGFQNVAPVVNQKVLAAEGPEFATILNRVSSLLTVKAIQQMNQAVNTTKQSPASIAHQFLAANGLV